MDKTPHLRFPDSMAYVPVPKDLAKIKTKLVMNLTKRQLICFSLAAAVGVPAYLLTRGAIGGSAAAIIMIGLMLPFFFLAMYERDGQPAETALRNYLRAKLWPGTRPYMTDNLYKYLDGEGKAIADQCEGAAAQGKGTAAPLAKKHKAGKRK
jgi:hypothetical protein